MARQPKLYLRGIRQQVGDENYTGGFLMSDAHDLRPHLEMWHGFLKLLGYSIVGIVILLGAMALFLL